MPVIAGTVTNNGTNGTGNGNGNGNNFFAGAGATPNFFFAPAGGNGNGNGNGSQGSSASFKGFVQEIPPQGIGIWRVAGRAVAVTQATRIKGSVSVGTKVKVVGFLRADGSVEATRIKRKGN